MNEKTELQLKAAIASALSAICRKDDNGVFYREIYADYRDALDDRTLKKICNDDHPREKFWELLDEWYCDCEWEYAANVIKHVLKDEDVIELVKNQDENEVRDLIQKQFYVKYIIEHYHKLHRQRESLPCVLGFDSSDGQKVSSDELKNKSQSVKSKEIRQMETTTVPTEAPKPTAAKETEQPQADGPHASEHLGTGVRNEMAVCLEMRAVFQCRADSAGTDQVRPRPQNRRACQQKTAQQHGRQDEQRPQAVDASDCGQRNR